MAPCIIISFRMSRIDPAWTQSHWCCKQTVKTCLKRALFLLLIVICVKLLPVYISNAADNLSQLWKSWRVRTPVCQQMSPYDKQIHKVAPLTTSCVHNDYSPETSVYSMRPNETIKSLDRVMESCIKELRIHRETLMRTDITYGSVNLNNVKFYKAYEEDFDYVQDQPFMWVIKCMAPFSDLKQLLPSRWYSALRIDEDGRRYRLHLGQWLQTTLTPCALLDQEQPLSAAAINMASFPTKEAMSKSNMALTFLYLIKGAFIYPNGEVQLVKNNVVLEPGGCIEVPITDTYNPEQYYKEVFTISMPTSSESHSDPITQILPRITPFLSFLLDNPSLRIHIPPLDIIKDTLVRMGLEEERLITGKVEVKIAYVPAGIACDKPAFYPSLLLSLHMRGMQPDLGYNKPRHLFIYMTGSQSRYFCNDDILYTSLKSLERHFGFELVKYSNSHTEDASLFTRALVIFGLSSPTMTKMTFSKPGTVVFEIQCEERMNNARLAYLLGHIYHAVVPQPDCYNVQPHHFWSPLIEYLNWFKHARLL